MHVHLIGIGGSGLSAIARILLENGQIVSGSDRQLSLLAIQLKEAGAIVYLGHRPENITGADMVVLSSAIPPDNVEVQAAHAAGIPVLKRADILGQLIADRECIAVAGTHGKTTTTAMIAWVLTSLGQEPSFIIGGVANNLGTNARSGQGKFFVVEADEYDRMFLGLRPDISLVTNVEYDHPDCFPTPEVFKDAFEAFANRLKPGGTLIACVDDEGAAQILSKAASQGRITKSYGLEEQPPAQPPDYVARDLHPNRSGGYDFNIFYKTTNLAGVSLVVPGKHNVLNAMGTLAVMHTLDLPMAGAAQALREYQGTGRRFEVRGEANGVIVIDDYAHHPTEIRATLAATRLRYPGRQVWVAWQPHTYSRTQVLFDDFVGAFADADHVVVTEVYAARESRQDFSSRQVVSAMKGVQATFVPGLKQAGVFLVKHLRPGDVLLVLSAGDAQQISVQVLDALSQESEHVSG